MAERSLTFHENKPLLWHGLARRKHCSLHRTGSEINPNGIQWNPLTTDQNPCLTRSDEG